jgi:hypothetical protein
VTRQQHDRRDAAPHPRPAEGGDGGNPGEAAGRQRAAPPPAFSSPASPSSAVASGDADSAGETHPPPDLTSTNADPGDPPNGQVPALPAEARAELERLFGPSWRQGPQQQADETQADFEAKRERFHAELDAFFARNPSETETETEQK